MSAESTAEEDGDENEGDEEEDGSARFALYDWGQDRADSTT